LKIYLYKVSAPSIQDIVAMPLTGLRYLLSDKLLKINTPARFTPASADQVDGLIEALEAAELNINQLFNIKFKTQDLLEAIAQKKNVADRMWDLIISLKIIVADKKLPEELLHNIDRLIRDWQGNIFPAEELKHIMQELLSISHDRGLDAELANAQKAILQGLAPQDINLGSPEKQLIWAAHILFLIYNPYLVQTWPESRRKAGPELVKSALWKQLLDCHQVKYLRAIFGSHIYNLLRKTDIMVGWGAPGSWFYYASTSTPARINCDLLYSMLVGFDHARACAVHEIGHAVQTRGVPDHIQDLSDVLADMEGQDAQQSASQVLKLQHYFLNCCEDNCVNRYTAEIGKILGQDYGFSLNYWYTAIGDIGRRYVRKEVIYTEDTPQIRFKNLTFIISRLFCAHNGLFEDSYEGWESLMARPDWIQGRDRNNPDVKLPQVAAFEQLKGMCEEVEYFFPDIQEMAGGPEYYAELAATYAPKRYELIHEIWQLYAQDLMDEITEQKPEDVEESMDRFQVEMNPTPPPPKKEKKKEEEKEDGKDEEKDNKDNPNPPQSSDNNSTKESEEELEGEEPKEEKPQEDDSGGGDGEDESAGDSADTPPEDSDDAGDDGDTEEQDQEQGSEPDQGGSGAPNDPKPKDQEKKDPEEKEEEESEEKERQEKEMEGPPPEGAETKPEEVEQQDEVERPENTEQKDAPEEAPQEVSPEELEKLMEQLMEQFKQMVDLKEDKEAEEEVVEDEENAEAELIREVEDDSLPPEQKPEEEKKEDTKGDRGDAKGGDADSTGVLDRESQDESMVSIEDLLAALEANQDPTEEEKARRKPLEEEAEEKEKLKFDIPPPMNLDQLAKGDWDDFNRRVALLGPVIAVMAKALEKLKDAQLKLISKISKKHQLIPPGGDLRRFDQGKMQALIERISKNEKFDTDHLSMFRKDDRSVANTRPTRVILIDGSRSMTFGGQPLPMDKAIQEAIIDYMASRIAGYDTYITMFGPTNPILLAEPGDNLVEIGKRIEKVHGGLNTMTYLAPALLQVIEKVAYRKKFEESYVGFTNFVIYTDGDIDDAKHSREIIHQIFQHAPKSTFDFVMITDKHATPMDVLIRTLDVKSPIHEIGVVRSTAKRQYPLALTATMKLTGRISKTKSGFADPAFLRTGQFKRLLHHLTR
jgi:hypothetical protein